MSESEPKAPRRPFATVHCGEGRQESSISSLPDLPASRWPRRRISQVALGAREAATMIGVGLGFTRLDPIKALFYAAVINGVISAPIKVKRKLLEGLMATLAQAGLDTENVMVCFKKTSWENWSFAGGRLIHV